MNILSISSILPVPGYLKINDFLPEFYSNYCKVHPDTHVHFIFPVKYSTSFLEKLLGENTSYKKIRKLKSYTIQKFTIEIITFLSIQRFIFIHTILSFTGYYFNLRRLRRIITENNIDIIHAQYIIPDGAIAYKLNRAFGLPYIITSHNETRYLSNRNAKGLILKILKNAFRITPINHTNYVKYQKLGLTNLEFIPLGYNRDYLDSIKKKSGEEVVRIISLANLIKLKNLDKVIIALSMLKDKYNFIYSIAGNGPEKENLQNLIKSLDMGHKVKLLGSVPYEEIKELLSEHDIFILTSYFETFGRAYFEAMAIGLPVICAKDSGIYGIFKEMEQGISVNHSDIEDIKNKLELLISDSKLRTSIGENGKKLVQDYTWEKISITYGKLYEKALNSIST